MNVSSVTSANASHYADALRASLAAKAQASASAAPRDADGDHDGSVAGRIDVKA